MEDKSQVEKDQKTGLLRYHNTMTVSAQHLLNDSDATAMELMKALPYVE
jgi:hypothetical protein